MFMLSIGTDMRDKFYSEYNSFYAFEQMGRIDQSSVTMLSKNDVPPVSKSSPFMIPWM